MGEVRTDRQAYLFHRDRLKGLKTGINKVLDILHGVLCEEACTDSDQDPKKLAEYYQCLQRVEQETWHRLHEEFIAKNISYDEGGGDHQEEATIAQVLLQFVTSLDEIKDDIKHRLKVKNSGPSSNEVELQAKLDEARQEKLELKLALHEIQYEEEEREEQPAVFLKEKLKQKQDRIAELERANISQLWEKERNRIIETSAKRETELAKELQELKKKHENMKRRLVAKVKDLEDKHKLMKIKSELAQKSSVDANHRKTEDLQRKLYIIERDLKKTKADLLVQHKLVVGCIKGIRTDFSVIANRRNEGEFQEQDARKLTMILDAIYDGAVEGRLEITKADLPLHYIALDEDLNTNNRGRMSVNAIGLRKKIDRHLSSITNTGPSLPSIPDRKAKASVRIRRNLVTIETPEQRRKKKSPRALKPRSPDDTNTNTGNPKLIDPETGQLDIECALRCFPNLEEMEIREHREHFKRYDTNSDCTLDLSELVRAVQSIVGNYYTPKQIKEAMSEIDTNNDEIIDFYEYLAVSSQLMENSGKGEIFRSNIIRQTNTSVSKICAIQ